MARTKSGYLTQTIHGREKYPRKKKTEEEITVDPIVDIEEEEEYTPPYMPKPIIDKGSVLYEEEEEKPIEFGYEVPELSKDQLKSKNRANKLASDIQLRLQEFRKMKAPTNDINAINKLTNKYKEDVAHIQSDRTRRTFLTGLAQIAAGITGLQTKLNIGKITPLSDTYKEDVAELRNQLQMDLSKIDQLRKQQEREREVKKEEIGTLTTEERLERERAKPDVSMERLKFEAEKIKTDLALKMKQMDEKRNMEEAKLYQKERALEDKFEIAMKKAVTSEEKNRIKEEYNKQRINIADKKLEKEYTVKMLNARTAQDKASVDKWFKEQKVSGMNRQLDLDKDKIDKTYRINLQRATTDKAKNAINRWYKKKQVELQQRKLGISEDQLEIARKKADIYAKFVEGKLKIGLLSDEEIPDKAIRKRNDENRKRFIKKTDEFSKSFTSQANKISKNKDNNERVLSNMERILKQFGVSDKKIANMRDTELAWEVFDKADFEEASNIADLYQKEIDDKLKRVVIKYGNITKAYSLEDMPEIIETLTKDNIKYEIVDPRFKGQ